MKTRKVKARCWVRVPGGIIRLLEWSSYAPCFVGGAPRSFLYRLPASDRRSRGRRLGYDDPRTQEWFAKLPIGQWIEIG